MFFPQNFGEDLCTGLSLKVELLFREKWVGGMLGRGVWGHIDGWGSPTFLKVISSYLLRSVLLRLKHSIVWRLGIGDLMKICPVGPFLLRFYPPNSHPQYFIFTPHLQWFYSKATLTTRVPALPVQVLAAHSGG